MLKQNIRLHLVSGHRSASDQRRIFIDKMDISEPATIISGIHDEAIEQILARSALPGFSKHHSGYAVDFGCGNDYLVYSFAETECYEWMSDNNFESIKKYGFIPSYPDGVENQGPNPEPWEYVWVGSDFLE
jgi:LAS superfamily LD-carboxypeptidase LdcB